MVDEKTIRVLRKKFNDSSLVNAFLFNSRGNPYVCKRALYWQGFRPRTVTSLGNVINKLL